MDDQTNRPSPPSRGRAFRAAAVLLAFVSLCGMGFLMLKVLRPAAPAGDDKAAWQPAKPSRLFHDWPRDRKPDLVLVLSGEQHGYLQPCGCSSPQYGGLPRRYAFMHGLTKERGWPVVALDLGDVAQKNGPQAKLKYRYSMEALKLLDYSAVGVGVNEMSMPLFDALAEFALNNPEPPVLVANLQNPQIFAGMIKSFVVGGKAFGGKAADLKVGVTAVVGPSVVAAVRDPNLGFDAVIKTLPGALQAMKAQKPDLQVLLYQGTAKEAAACAEKFQEFQMVLSLSNEEEPPERPTVVGKAQVVQVGWKGRSVGVMGVYRTGKADRPFELHYQLAPLGPEYETPAGREKSNPVIGLLEKYSDEVKRGNYLAQYMRSKHPIQADPRYKEAVYVGSEKCKSCHKESYKVWKASPHAHAYQTLVDAKRPSLRQFDGECVVCHVTGFKYVSGFANKEATPELLENGCENCHGPGSLHVKNANRKITDAQLNTLMNPFREPPNEAPQAKQRRMLMINNACVECHDSDNDNSWNINKWEKIAHKEPGLRQQPNAAAQPNDAAPGEK